jgi:hypothetical protein
VLLGRVWRLAFPWLSTAAATNLLSAACTALAGAVIAGLVSRWTRSVAIGVAAGIAAGTMSSVWANATETEVYAASLALAAVMLWAGERAGHAGGTRYATLLAYIIGLTVPVHLSALVAAPGAIALAAQDGDGRVDRGRVLQLGGVMFAAAAIGTARWTPLVPAAVCVFLACYLDRASGRVPIATTLSLGFAALLGASAIAILLVRARHDPAINQGNPATVAALLEVVGRRQYDVAPLWPRQAPFWLQIGNLVQYTDWQVALGVDRAVGASALRTPWTLMFVLLGVTGSRAHRAADRRSWWAMLVLFLSATIGVAVYLNLKAGPSYGYGVLADNAPREARERDYFFALGFWCAAAWAGIGAVAVVRRLAGARRAALGIAVAGLPLLLNWRAMDRRREPEAQLARTFAVLLLESAPLRAVVFVAGDNDSYPVWYVQQALAVRRDVVTITVPLLGADWYREELRRRWGLLDSAAATGWLGRGATMRAIANRAQHAGRPVTASVGLPAPDRASIGGGWVLTGMVYERRGNDPVSSLDRAALAEAQTRLRLTAPGALTARVFEDPTERYVAALLACPGAALLAVQRDSSGVSALLDSRCNYR